MTDQPLRDPDIILFDLDGTLIDSVPDLTEATNRMLRDRGLPPVGDHEVRNWVGNGTWRLVERALGLRDASAGDPADVREAYERFHAHYAACCMDRTRIFENAPELIRAIRDRNIRTAIVTNKPDIHAQRMMGAWSSLLPMDAVIGQREGHPRKPDPTMLRQAMEACGSRTAWMVGDSEVDGLAARALGLDFIGVRLGYNQGRDIAEMRPAPALVFDDLGDLLAWFHGRDRSDPRMISP